MSFFSRKDVALHLYAVVTSAINNRIIFAKTADVIFDLQCIILLDKFNFQSCLATQHMLCGLVNAYMQDRVSRAILLNCTIAVRLILIGTIP